MGEQWRRVAVAVAVVCAVACTPGREPVPEAAPSAVPSVTAAPEAARTEPATTPGVAGVLRPSEPFGLTRVTLRAPDGRRRVALAVYDAHTPAARARGLMHREHLPRRAGMVFRFRGPSRGGFYMKNTLIPLSIAFFDQDGTVVDVLDMEPCRTDPCPTYTPRSAYTGALEVNRGFFDAVGLQPGWRVELAPRLVAPQ